MEISNLTNSINSLSSQDKNYLDSLLDKNLVSEKSVSIKTGQNNQNIFKQKLQDVAKNTEQIQDIDTSEISTYQPKSITENQKQIIKQIQNTFQTINSNQTESSKTIKLTPENIPFLNQLEKKENEKKSKLELLISNLKKDSNLGTKTIDISGTQMYKSWLKKIKNKQQLEDEELKETEETNNINSNNNTSNNIKSSKINILNNPQLLKNSKLYSLNIPASLRFLKNLKKINQKFSPEMVVYDEVGSIDPEETLKCLGWEKVEKFQYQLNNELNIESIKQIYQDKKILYGAQNSGLDVLSGKHPLNQNDNLIAIEKITGEMIILDKLADLQKIELKEKIFTIYQKELG